MSLATRSDNGKVKNRVGIGPNAPHSGPIFDREFNQKAIFQWLGLYLKGGW
ncbi:hypothetical protein [Larkinella rosea]|uniref:hypothetical protein n=1 Tax=Larkinella rosea TaxID=2025312 RepID=UPI00163A7AF1|nr:hypothetical protein [Larkinella rosea]